MSSQMRQFSTGLPFLDRRLDGGLPAGCLLALTASPRSQSELLLRQLAQTRQSLFISMMRPTEEVHTEIAGGTTTPPALTVTEQAPDGLLADFSPIESLHTPESFVLIDRMNGLEETTRTEYLGFLNQLSEMLQRTDSVGVLHCSETSPLPPQRGLTLDRADQVWQLELLYRSREIKNRLLVTKSRNGRALTEPIDLLLTDRVQVDTSRRIS